MTCSTRSAAPVSRSSTRTRSICATRRRSTALRKAPKSSSSISRRERSRHVQKQIDAVRKAREAFEKVEQKLVETPRGTTTREKRKYRRAKWAAMRAQIEVSQRIREIEFTEAVKRRLIEEMKDAVEGVKGVQREIEAFDRMLNPKNKKQRLKEEDRKNVLKNIKDLRVKLKTMTDTLEQEPA